MIRSIRSRLRPWALLLACIIGAQFHIAGQELDLPTEYSLNDGGDRFVGYIRVDHAKFDDHVFVKSYVYVFELNEYIEVEPGGSFEVIGLPEGRYSFKTYVPGFEPEYATITFPDQRRIIIGIELQNVELPVVTVPQAIPSYLRDIRDLIQTPEITEETRPITPIPLPTPDGRTPASGFSLNSIIDAFRNLFGADGDEEE